MGLDLLADSEVSITFTLKKYLSEKPLLMMSTTTLLLKTFILSSLWFIPNQCMTPENDRSRATPTSQPRNSPLSSGSQASTSRAFKAVKRSASSQRSSSSHGSSKSMPQPRPHPLQSISPNTPNAIPQSLHTAFDTENAKYAPSRPVSAQQSLPKSPYHFINTIGKEDIRNVSGLLEQLYLECPEQTPLFFKSMNNSEIEECFYFEQILDAFWISLFCRRNHLILDIMDMMSEGPILRTLDNRKYSYFGTPAIGLQLRLSDPIFALIRNHANSTRLTESLHAILLFFDRQGLPIDQPLSALDIAIITDKLSVIPNLAANYYSIAQSMYSKSF